MVLPFEPLTVAFQDLKYYIDTPVVILLSILVMFLILDNAAHLQALDRLFIDFNLPPLVLGNERAGIYREETSTPL